MDSTSLAASIKKLIIQKYPDYAPAVWDSINITTSPDGQVQAINPLSTKRAQIPEWFARTIAEACAEAIVSHIQNYATVSTRVAVASVSGVAVGAGVSGPGAGSGTGNIS